MFRRCCLSASTSIGEKGFGRPCHSDNLWGSRISTARRASRVKGDSTRTRATRFSAVESSIKFPDLRATCLVWNHPDYTLFEPVVGMRGKRLVNWWVAEA